jgi:hypothetical protein
MKPSIVCMLFNISLRVWQIGTYDDDDDDDLLF